MRQIWLTVGKYALCCAIGYALGQFVFAEFKKSHLSKPILIKERK